MPLPREASPRKANYRVRFRHGVFPDAEGQATRADIKKYDYFFSAGQKWVDTEGKCKSKPRHHPGSWLFFSWSVCDE